MRYLIHLLIFQLVTVVCTVAAYFAFGAEWGTSRLENWIQFGTSLMMITTLMIIMIKTFTSSERLSFGPKFFGSWSLVIGFHATAYVLNILNIHGRSIDDDDIKRAMNGMLLYAIVYGIISAVVSSILESKISDKSK